jgi:hypothetical protein
MEAMLQKADKPTKRTGEIAFIALGIYCSAKRAAARHCHRAWPYLLVQIVISLEVEDIGLAASDKKSWLDA